MLMTKWQTTVHLTVGDKNIKTEPIQIKRGIFQGDSLSALWFCLALNPLSNILNKSKYGFDLKSNSGNRKISHLLYMDDLKIYAATSNQLNQQIKTVEIFTHDINMEFGLDKCKTLNIRKGKVELGGFDTQQGGRIEPMEETDIYKYLGMLQSKRTEHIQIKRKLIRQYTERLNTILKTKLNTKNLVKAINTFVMPLLVYSFGIINWTSTDLDNLDRILRTTMTKHRMHHKNSSTERITLPRNEGGLGIVNIKNLHNSQIKLLRNYFHNRKHDSYIHNIVCNADINYTPLNLHDNRPQDNEQTQSVLEQVATWQSKALHGRHVQELARPEVDKHASNAWLTRGELFPETTGHMLAIQDQVISTKNYRKYILKDPSIENDTCRKCNMKTENIQHITGGCTTLAQSDYTHRHNQIANIVHQELAITNALIANDNRVPYYKYTPHPVIENEHYKLYYDRSVLTDRTIHHNRPDIVLYNKAKNEAYIIDVAVPNTHNITSTIQEKLRKYVDLKNEIKRIWSLEKVHIVPLVVSTTGIIPNSLQENLQVIGLKTNLYALIQKAAILNTCRIVRKFLDE